MYSRDTCLQHALKILLLFPPPLSSVLVQNSYIDLSILYLLSYISITLENLVRRVLQSFKIPRSASYLLRFLLSLLFPLVIHPSAYFHRSTFCRGSLLTSFSLSLSLSLSSLSQSNREATPARRGGFTRTRSNLKLPAI